jgi:hypothetical protein
MATSESVFSHKGIKADVGDVTGINASVLEIANDTTRQALIQL